MIEIKDLEKRFGDKKLFEEFSIQVPDGSFWVIRGKSGCGKSTLLHMIGGIEKPDAGKILLDGKDIFKDIPRKEYFGKKVGFVFQNFALLENETVRENLNLIPRKYRSGMSRKEVLDKVGMSDSEEKRIYQLSGGEQQRIAIARILMKQCDLVLADEPTGSLDPENAAFVVKCLKECQEEGRTVIVVTHSEIFDRMATKRLDL